MKSLSEELLRLSELFASGILSDEEFKAAKEATIRQYTSASSSSSSLPLQSQPTTTTMMLPSGEELRGCGGRPDAHTPFSRIDISGFSDDALEYSQREGAYSVLETILRNLQQFPAELKYRRLRLGNPALQSRLFLVSGVMQFLKSLGFVVVEQDDGGDGWIQLNEAPQKFVIDEALAAVRYLQCRDQNAQANTRDYMRLRRNFSLEVRRERCEKAKAVGELRSYIAQEFCCDDAGDGLYSSMLSLEKLRVILMNVLRFPAEGKYRRLRLSNRAVYTAVLQQRGGLELILECAGGEIVEEAGGEAFLLLREGVATDSKVQCALQVLEETQLAVQETHEKLNQQAREEAQEAMRAQARRAREEELHRLRLQRNSEEVESPNLPEGNQQRRRVPIAEAVRILMGKGGCEEREKE